MGWSEQRGRLWRARWHDPEGNLQGESGFASKKESDQYWQDREAEIRAGRYVDPRAGLITLQEWVNLWFPSLDLEPTTLKNYRYFLEGFILPVFGHRPLASLTYEEIATWTRELATVNGYAKRTAEDARTTFATCLSAAMPHRIQYNPAAKKKETGRKGVRRIEKATKRQKPWVRPLDAFRFAERCAALTGRWEDFVLQTMYYYTGARWGEGLALKPEHVADKLHLNSKLYELGGHFYTGHPKDGSIRALDLPPFLRELLDTITPRRCTCKPRERQPGDPEWCQGDTYLFLGPEGGHPRRSTYGRRVIRPAADGMHPATTDKGGKPMMPVLVDLSEGWPGTPVVAWPSPEKGLPYVPPRLAERSRGRKTLPPDTPIASWAPIMYGLTEHGLRHSHQTLMGESRIADVLRDERMGHSVEDDVRIASAMRDLYTHVSTVMRGELVDALTRHWQESCMGRVRLEQLWPEGFPRRSSAPGVDDLLAPYRQELIVPATSIQARTVARRRRPPHENPRSSGSRLGVI